nr:M10 family metallopeptidase C-terminal domain-containing protein [Fuscovulum sp.]
GLDNMGGDAGNDTVMGGAVDDILRGDAGNDLLQGDAGIDRLTGGAGADRLTGGADRDVFIFRDIADSGTTAATQDRITDFTAGEDRLNLSDLGLLRPVGQIGAALTGLAGQVAFRVVGGNGLVEADTDGNGIADFSVVLEGVAALALADVIF